MYQACIFDLDGTLADTIESITYSVNETLKELHLPPITKKQCESFIGSGAKRLIEQSLQASGDEGLDLLPRGMEIYRRIFSTYCTYHVTPYEGILELLCSLRKSNVQLAVLSNKPHEQTVKVVEEVFGADTFAYVQGQSDEIPRKPDPTGVYRVLEDLQVPKEACLYIGDSDVDMQTGKAAGVTTVGVTWGFRSRQVLEEQGADFLIDQAKDIMKIVEDR